MFCKAPFTSRIGSLKHNTSKVSSTAILHLCNQTLRATLCQNIKMSNPYKSPVGWARWTPVRNTAIELT